MQPSSSQTPAKLVDFDFPPVSETAISIQFASPMVDIAVLAAFTIAVRETAPHVSHQPVLPRMEETFNAPAPVPMFQFVDQAAGLPRTWFAGDDGYLVQLQPDRMTLNWRRSGDDYPGYASVRKRFDKHLEQLQVAVLGAHRVMPPIDLCEVAYVNPIEVPDDQQDAFAHPDLASLINRVQQSPAVGFLGQPEDALYQARWRIKHPLDPGRPVGRLHVSASPTVADGHSLYMVNVLARVKPGQEEEYDAVNMAHEYVVLGFTDLTTKHMHEFWKRKETT